MIDLIVISSTSWIWPALIWTIIWKGIALWKAGRNNQAKWFIFILVLNTLGILPIFYLVFFQKKQPKSMADKMEAEFKRMVNKKDSKRRRSVKKSLRKK